MNPHHATSDINTVHRKQTNHNLALTAAALQDQWSKTLSLGPNIRTSNKTPLQRRVQQQKKNISSVVDSGLGKNRENTTGAAHNGKENFCEKVLDRKPPSLSLAQKMGLAAAPPALLTEKEWHEVKQKSNKRDDSKQPCVICKEDFGLHPQVLLSCTHVFHRVCLEAFERFTGNKSCPLCRRQQYQTRLIYEGAKYHHIRSAIRIQATWRGHVVRTWYKKLRETIPPKDPKLRKKYYEQKLQNITDRMIASVDYDVNAFLTEIDASVQQSRSIYKQIHTQTLLPLTELQWQQIYIQAVERGNSDCPICLTSLEDSKEMSERRVAIKQEETSKHSNPKGRNKSTNDKCQPKRRPAGLNLSVLHESFVREQKSVLVTKHTATSKGSISDMPDDFQCFQGRRACVLLSCTHVFHQVCLEAFEEFSESDIKNVCPICRAYYQKKNV